MNRDLLDSWLERTILGVALVLLVFLPLAFGGRPQAPAGTSFDFLLLNPFLVAQAGIAFMAILWGIRLWVAEKPRLLFPPVCWAVLAFTLYAMVRYFYSDIEYVARLETIKVLAYALLFFIVLNNLHRQEHTQLLSYVLVFLAMAIAGWAIYQFATGSDRVWHTLKPYHGRGSGTYICPNHLGGLLEMALPLGLAFTLTGRIKPLGRILLGYACLVLIAGVAVTLSRGTWVATLLAVLFLFGTLMVHSSYRVAAVLALVLLIGAGAYFGPRMVSFQKRIRQVYQDGKLDDDARFSLWKPALDIWQTNPWWGAGPAHFDPRFPQFRPQAIQARPDRAHNDILNSLADFGLVGTTLVVTAWALLGWGALKTFRHVRKTPKDIGGTSSSSKFACVLGCSAALVAILLHSAVDFNMHIPANAFVAVLLMGILSSHMRFATKDYWLTPGAVTKVLTTLLLLAGSSCLLFEGVRETCENRLLAGAGRAPDFSDKQLQLLKQAAEAEPMNPQTCSQLGEAYRVLSAQGDEQYEDKAHEAMQWFRKAMQLNPFDGDSAVRYAWCLDWLGRTDESGPWLEKGERLDPNGYMTTTFVGLHYVQTRQFAAAKPWLERSLKLKFDTNNVVARNYLTVVDSILAAGAASPAQGTPPRNEQSP